MTRDEIIKNLRDKAKSSKIASDIFTVCAMRERSRASLTIAGLSQRMKAKGYHYDRNEYEQFLAFLGNLGLGDIVTSRTGRVRALRNIHITLKSIGDAAMNNDKFLRPFTVKNKFTPLMANKPPVLTNIVEAPIEKTNKYRYLKTTPIEKSELSRYIKLIVSVDDKPWELQVPPNATNDDIARIIDAIRHK